MSKKSFAGAAALLCAPLAVILAVSIIPTLSDKAADQVTAVHRHRDAMLAGMTLQTVTLVLLVAGTIWLAFSLYRHAPRWGFTGGVLGVAGALIVLFIDSVHAGAIAAALNFEPAQATLIVDRILSSRVVAIFEPLQVLQDLGLVLLAVAAAKSGVSRWAAAALAAGAVAEGAGFAGGSRPLVGIAFAVMFAGLLPIVLNLAGSRSPQPARAAQPVAA